MGDFMKETIHIEVERYTTTEGDPTCSLNVETQEVCRFMASRQFGLQGVCVLSGNDIYRKNNKTGFHVPEKSCPVWAAKKEPL
jgi:hypothetical protein